MFSLGKVPITVNYGIAKVLSVGAYHVVSGSVNWGQSHWHLRVVKLSAASGTQG